MSASIVTARPAQPAAGGLRGTMQRHPIVSYFIIMFAGLWLGYSPLLLSNQGFGILNFTFPVPAALINLPASLLGPLVAGVVMSWVVGGKEGRREFRKRLFRFKFGAQWYVLAIAGVPVLGVLSVVAVQGFSAAGNFVSQFGSVVVSFLVNAVLLAVIVNLWEESGQVGFALPYLQSRHGAVLASLIIAPMWALMHLPALFVPDLGVGIVDGPVSFQGVLISMGVLVVYAIPVRILATWLFNSVGQSVVLVAVFHASMNAAQGIFGQLVPGYNAFYMLGAFAVAGFVLIAVTRGKLGYKTEVEQDPAGMAGAAQTSAGPLVQV
jgi:membrane protease YdiL (CAAX protease family)